MRIAILADPLDTQSAGIHVYTRELLYALTHLNTPHEFVIIRSKVGNEDFGNAKQIIVPIHSIPFHIRLRQLLIIPKIIRQQQIDIVIEPAHFGPFNLPKHIKRVTVIHDLTPIFFPKFHPFMSVVFHKLFLKKTLRKTDLIITNSQHTTKDVIQAFPFAKQKTATTLLGYDTSYTPKTDAAILKKHNIQTPYILYMGTIEPRKNLGILLRAFEKWKAQYNRPHQLVLAGKKGWHIDEFYTAVNQSKWKNEIRMTGFVDKADMAVLYSMASVFVYPSLYEGFGLPILEAMACGTPVICSNTSSMPEVGGDCALYFDPTNEETLVQLLEKSCTISIPKSKLIRHTQQFNWNKTAKDTLAIFEKHFL